VDYDRVLANPDVQLWEHYSQTVWHLGYDNTNEWFKNKLVRQAINYAVDREACLEVGHNGHGKVMYNCSTIAPTCLGAIENPNNKYSYDPEKAKALMKEANCPGFETEIIVFRDEAERIAVLVQSYLEVIGIKAKVTRIENAVFASTIANHKAPMFITSWGAYWDPDLFLARRFTQAGIGGVNRVWYLNPELDVMIEKGRASFDNAVRAKTYEEIQKFMIEEAPECDLYVNTMYALATKDLKGVEINVEMPYHYYKLHY
jgi:ABC-type transport system substrate-binding protein